MSALRKQVALIFITLIVSILPAMALSEDYKYDINDIIPESVQADVINRFLDKESGIFSENVRTYSEILESYLKRYGIYPPESQRNNANVVWVQNTLLNDSRRVTYIPDRYISPTDLSDWVQRYAAPGDLLLYRASGLPDKCVVYAGEGKIVGRYMDETRLLSIRATYVTGEYARTRSGGLFAIAHIWSDEEPVKAERINLVVETNADTGAFTGDQYSLYIMNPEDGQYVKTNKYVVFEYGPGNFRIWDGNDYGLPVEYIKQCGGIYVQLALNVPESGQMIRRIKIAVPYDNLPAEANEYVYTLRNAVITENVFQWNGADMLSAIDGK